MSMNPTAPRSGSGSDHCLAASPPRVAVIVPAWNEESTVAAVIEGLRSNDLVHEIVVVDGGSSDATAERARAAGARVVVDPRRGYGRACLTGAHAADSAQVLLFVDADGSVDTTQVARLLEPLSQCRADLVIGSRIRGRRARGAMPRHQHLGNVLVAAILRRRHHVAVTDVGPFRAVRAGVLAQLDMREMTYGWPTEMIVRAAARGCRIVEVPVDQHARTGGRSKVSGDPRASLRAGIQMLRVAWFGGGPG